MVTSEDLARLHVAGALLTSRVREEIDAAYDRGFNDGRDSISALPLALISAVSGALSMLGYFTFFV